jgi:hypothetical protein
LKSPEILKQKILIPQSTFPAHTSRSLYDSKRQSQPDSTSETPLYITSRYQKAFKDEEELRREDGHSWDETDGKGSLDKSSTSGDALNHSLIPFSSRP